MKTAWGSRDLLVAGGGSAGDNYNTWVGKRKGGEEEDRRRQKERRGKRDRIEGEEGGGDWAGQRT
jgi:hypothetical protein